MVQTNLINFIDLEGNFASIEASDLEKYPESLLSMINSNKDRTKFDVNADAYEVDFLEDTLKHVAEFYATGKWPNPFVQGNQLRLANMSGDFFTICDYLKLPCEFGADEEDFDDWDEQDYRDSDAYFASAYADESEDDYYDADRYDDSYRSYSECKV